MQTSIISRILSVLSQSEIEELFDHTLSSIESKKPLLNIENNSTNSSELKSIISFSCRLKRLSLGLGIYAVAKSSGILPSQIRSIEEGGDYSIDDLSKLFSFLKLKVAVTESTEESVSS